jgi:hypothetical protein
MRNGSFRECLGFLADVRVIRLSFVLVIFLCLYATARASFIWITYSQWARLTRDQQEAYLAGAWDSYANIVGSPSDYNRMQHYTKCMHDSGMNLGQFRDHVAAYAETHPNLQGGDMQPVMIKYLIELCGAPPQ